MLKSERMTNGEMLTGAEHCEVCSRRPATEFMVVRHLENPRHVAKGHVCISCFEGIATQVAGAAVESVGQSEWNEVVAWEPPD